MILAFARPQPVSWAGQSDTSMRAAATGLRAEIQDIVQAIGLRGEPPRTLANERVYCDSLKLTLLVAHDGRSAAPILINSIAVNARAVEKASIATGSHCDVDRFSSQPHGIIEKNTFFFTLSDGAVKSRFLRDAATAIPVDQKNLLSSPSISRAIALTPNEQPVVFDAIVQSFATQPQALTFTIAYDHDGARMLTTKPIVVWK
jgi:hypothetical protein